MSKRFLLVLILSGVTALVLSGCGADADIDAKHGDGYTTPLHVAVKYNHLDVARLLIDRGADIDAKSYAGWTPLHQAAFDNNCGVARLLIDRGADIESKSNTGGTPLWSASANKRLDVARLLIEKAANPDGLDLSWMN